MTPAAVGEGAGREAAVVSALPFPSALNLQSWSPGARRHGTPLYFDRLQVLFCRKICLVTLHNVDEWAKVLQLVEACIELS